MKCGNQFLSLYFVWLEKAMEENLLSGRWRPIQFQIQIPSKKEEANPISQKKETNPIYVSSHFEKYSQNDWLIQLFTNPSYYSVFW